ncbi:MAG: UDP-N-acetylmuramoyl-L-alanine--D-glutamate ligase [Anaerolineaceae bacterium]|nr:UDP-N-acetylmuramoyl-L-alanine--D-glutamate ligase [Anaerolineaceae bacterium]
MKNWNGRKVLLIGAARQGMALTRYLIKHGAEVTLTDSRNEEQLSDVLQSLDGLPVKWALGGHPLEILDDKDLVCLSGGVPLTLPLVLEARKRNLELSNDSQIFFDSCPCRIVGITGSAGKTTTTALVGKIANAHTEIKKTGQKVWVGGNIGNPLIENVDDINKDDLAILELSSFQLEIMKSSPHIAAILNITPNHLDRHLTMQAYALAKAKILTFQSPSDIAVLNRDDKGSWEMLDVVNSNLLTFGLQTPPSHINGTFVKREQIYLQLDNQRIKMLPVDWIQLPGEHNLYNVLAACAISTAASLVLPAIQEAIDNFQGVSHRLKFVRNHNGVDWYNDSIATAPERTMAAIKAIDTPIILLAGGRDKDLPWEDFASLVKQRVDHLICFGEVAAKIIHAFGEIESGSKPFSITHCNNLQQAIGVAAELAQSGDSVLLSPGGTSFDEFKDFEERGEKYIKWVNELS